MSHDTYPNSQIRRILGNTQTIAMVGASPKWNRPSYFAMKYLLEKGYQVVPINPGHAGETILGQRVYASLADVPGPVHMVDIFRNSEAAGTVVDEVIGLAKDKDIRTIWMQLGVRNDAAAALAEAAGLEVIMNRCPKIEFGRLNAELSWGGFDSKVITAKRRRLTAG